MWNNIPYLAQVISKFYKFSRYVRSRLTDRSRESTTNASDEQMEIPEGEYGVSRSYRALKKLFVKVTPSGAIQSWENTLSTTSHVKVILEGWSNVLKHILCEYWRETQFRFIHKAIYGFNIPRSGDNPAFHVACPKCQNPRTDMWHGICPASQAFWDQMISYIEQHWSITLSRSPEQKTCLN